MLKTKKPHPTLSLILPVYKQVDQIEVVIKNFRTIIRRLPVPIEVLFVVNGPDDGSYTILAQACEKTPQFRVVKLSEGGWGKAVLFGLSQTRGTYVCYTNTARTDIEKLVMIVKLALTNKTVLIKATRIVRETWLRKVGSTLYNIEARLLFNIPVWDVNATPKIFPRSILKKLQLVSEDDLFDVELIAQCFTQGVPILEVPVYLDHRQSGKSTTSVLSALKMYVGLVRMKYGSK